MTHWQGFKEDPENKVKQAREMTDIATRDLTQLRADGEST